MVWFNSASYEYKECQQEMGANGTFCACAMIFCFNAKTMYLSVSFNCLIIGSCPQYLYHNVMGTCMKHKDKFSY